MNAELAKVREAIVTENVTDEARELCEKHYGMSEAEMDREIERKERLIEKHRKLMALREQVRQMGLKEERDDAIEIITEVVGRNFNVSKQLMLSANREERVAYPRQVIFYIARELTTMSLAEIGRVMGGKDHGTVIYGIKSVRDRIETSAEYNNTVQLLTAQCAERLGMVKPDSDAASNSHEVNGGNHD